MGLQFGKLGMVIYSYSPSSGEAEMGHSLELTSLAT